MLELFKVEGPAQVGLSGGRTSGNMGFLMLQAMDGNVPPDVHFTFQNTGKEMEETLVFIKEMQDRWGLPVTWLEYDRVYGDESRPRYRIVDFATASRNGEPFDKFLTYYDEYRKHEKNEPPILPNVVNRMCSDRMKIKATEWFMRDRMGYTEWDAYIGIRADEQARYHRQATANDKGGRRWESVMPLYKAGITKEDVRRFWAAQPFDLGIDSDFGNCDGCFLKHDDKLIRVFQEEPRRAIWWMQHEQRTGQVFRKNRDNYLQLAYAADNLKRQIPIPFQESEEESEFVDCMCGDGA